MNQLRNFKTILLTAVQNIYEVRRELARALLFPLIIYIPLKTFEFYGKSWTLYYIQYFSNFVIAVLVAIPVHRVILIGPDSVSKWGFNKWTIREAKFLGYSLALFMIYLLLMSSSSVVLTLATKLIGLDAAVVVVIYIIYFLVICIWARLSLVFPSTAIDGETSFRSSWMMTKKHQLLMILVIAFFPLGSYSLYYILPDNKFLIFIADLGYIAIEVFTIATLSTAYKFIMDERDREISLPPTV